MRRPSAASRRIRIHFVSADQLASPEREPSVARLAEPRVARGRRLPYDRAAYDAPSDRYGLRGSALRGPGRWAFPGVDASPWANVLWAAAAIAVPSAYCSLLAPRRARARLLKAVDPTVGPPPGAQPVDSPLIRHLDMLSADKHYDALRSMLSDDFAMVVGRVEFGATSYIRSLRTNDRRQPGQRTTEQVVVHPDEPDLLWVRSTHCRKPRFGPAYVSTTWTRVRVTADQRRVREILPAGVLQVA
jgi:hypothetical protein